MPPHLWRRRHPPQRQWSPVVTTIAAAAVAAAAATALSAAAAAAASTAVVRSARQATAPPPADRLGGCAPRLATHPAEWAPCRNGSICLLFLSEPPFVDVSGVVADGSAADPSRLFPCRDFAARGVGGVAFELHAAHWPGATDMCAWAGPTSSCSFRELVQLLADARSVDHPANGMALGAGGLLFFTPNRVYLGDATAPIVEERIVLVRRISQEGLWSDGHVNLRALAWPLTPQAWWLIGSAFLTYLAWSGVLAMWRPTPVWAVGHGPSRRRTQLLQWVLNFIRNVFGGPLNAHEHDYTSAHGVHRSIPVLLATVSLLFLEAALILNGRPAVLTRPIRGLSDTELCPWLVHGGTAQEDLWVEVLNAGRRGNRIDLEAVTSGVTPRPWATCSSPRDCFDALLSRRVNPNPACGGARTEVYVSWTFEVRAVFRDRPDLCERLEVLDEEAELSSFNAGWMFADGVGAGGEGGGGGVPPLASPAAAATVARRRQELDAAIRRARIAQMTSRDLEAVAGSPATPCAAGRRRVHTGQLVIPLGVALAAPAAAATILACVVPRLTGALVMAAAVSGAAGV